MFRFTQAFSKVRNFSTSKYDKLKLVFDLDETLAFIFIPSEASGWQYQPDIQIEQVIQFPEFKTIGQLYVRPNVREFFEKYKNRYECYLHSTGEKIYTDRIADILDPKGDIFKKRFYRDNCIYAKSYKYPQREYLKTIKTVTNDFTRIVVIDDNWTGAVQQPDNFVHVPVWDAFYNDDVFADELPTLLEHLDTLPDVRPYIRSKFLYKHTLNDENLVELDEKDDKFADWLHENEDKLEDYEALKEAYYKFMS